MYFRKLTYLPFQRLPGFSKTRGHFLPERVSAAARDWALTLLDAEVQEELQAVYQNCKDILGLRHRQVTKEASRGEGSVETEFFRFSLTVGQNETNPAEVELTRKVVLLKPLGELPALLDQIFPVAAEELVVETGPRDFDELVERFEAMRDERGGRLRDNQSTGEIEYEGAGLQVFLSVSQEEMVIRPLAVSGCRALLELTQEFSPIEAVLPGIQDLG